MGNHLNQDYTIERIKKINFFQRRRVCEWLGSPNNFDDGNANVFNVNNDNNANNDNNVNNSRGVRPVFSSSN